MAKPTAAQQAAQQAAAAAAKRSAAAKKAAATRKRNAAAAAKKGTPPTKSKTPSKAKAPAKKTSSAKSPTPTTVPAPVQNIWNWVRKYWWIVLIVIALIWLFFKFASPWMSILEQRNNAAIANAQSQQAAPVTVPVATTGVSPTSPKDVIMDYGVFGSYKSEYDANLGKYVVIIDENSRVRAGQSLTDLKTASTNVSFVLPFDAVINNSAGTFYVNGVQWKLGNPVEDEKGNTIIPAGSNITITYGEKNDSAGWMIIFQ